MTIKTNSCEGFPDPPTGVTNSNQNSAGTSGDALTFNRGGSSTTIATTTAGEVIFGAKSLEVVCTGTETCSAYYLHATGGVGVDAISGRAVFRLPSAPGSSVDLVKVVQNGLSSKAMSLRIASTGMIYVKDALDASVYNTSAITFPAVVQLCWAVQREITTGNGKLAFACYDEDGALLGMASIYEDTTASTGATTLNQVDTGKLTAASWTVTYQQDAWLTEDTYALPDPFDNDPFPEWTVWNGTDTELPVVSAAIWNGVAEVAIASWARSTAAPVNPLDAGCDTIGTANFTLPGSGVVYVSPTGSDTTGTGAIGSPYATLAYAITQASAGNTIALRAGVYKEGSAPNSQLHGVEIDKQLTIQNYPLEEVWFDGADVIEDWTVSGSTWRTPWTYTFSHSPTFSFAGSGTSLVTAANPLACYPEQVWIDGVYQTQVASVGAVVAGTFYADQTNDYLYVGTNPTSATVRASVRCVAMTVLGAGSSTIIQGIGFRDYGNQCPDFGVVKLNRGSCTIRHCQIDNPATTGVSVYGNTYDNATIDHCTINRPGLLGIQSNMGNNLTLTNNRITDANHLGFAYGQSAGAIKFTRSQVATITGNEIVDPHGPGIWGDQSDYNVKIVGNNITGVDGVGICYENCTLALVANNLVVGNGSSTSKGIHVLGANDVSCWNNTVWNCRECMIVQDDTRTPANTEENTDSRYHPDANQVWSPIDSFVAKNNVLGQSANPLLRVKDDDGVAPKYLYTYFGLELDGNVYCRVSPGVPYSIIHLSYSPADLYYSSLSAYQAATTGLDDNSIFIDGTAAVDTTTYQLTAEVQSVVTTAGTARPLPSDVATAMGQPTGTAVCGVIR